MIKRVSDLKMGVLNKKHLLFFLIVLFAFLVRASFLGIVPAGLTNDEADIGYDAYSIFLTGNDQWGERFPLTAFKGFGDYRLPIYTYLVIPAISLFDLTVSSVRLPSAVFGTISVGLIFFLARKITEKSKLSADIASFAAMIFMAASPWAIGLSRIGIESNVAITFFIAALLLFFYALNSPKIFTISFLFFALTLYTYTSYTLFTPLSMIVLFFFYRKKILQNKKYVFLSIILFVVLVLPLFISRSAAGVRASQITFFNSQDSVGLSADLNDRRGSCSEVFPDIICKVSENKYKVFGNTFVQNYISHFSPNFLFLSGTTTQYSMLPQRSLLFTFELVFLALGVFAVLYYKKRNVFFVLCLLIISPLPDALTGDGHFSRASNMQPFLFLIQGLGVSYSFSYFKSKRKKYVIGLSALVLLLFSLASFLVSYFSYFPKHYSHFGQYGYEELSKTLLREMENYDRIYVSKFGNDTKQYIYLLFYNKYNPTAFQEKENTSYSDDNGWVSINRIQNIYFAKTLPSEKEMNEMDTENILLVSHPNEFSEGFKFTKTIVDKNNNEVFTFVKLSDYLEFLKKESSSKKYE